KQPMNIAVVDAGGNLVAHVRMDGAWMGSIDISINKAFTARAFDIETKKLGELSQSGDQFFGIHATNHGKIVIFAGGIPLKNEGSSSSRVPRVGVHAMIQQGFHALALAFTAATISAGVPSASFASALTPASSCARTATASPIRIASSNFSAGTAGHGCGYQP